MHQRGLQIFKKFVEAFDPKLVNPEKNLNQGVSKQKYIKGLLLTSDFRNALISHKQHSVSP